MKTIVILVSIGNRSRLTDYSVPRAGRWALRHGYSFVVIRDNIQPLDRTAHYAKLVAPRLFPHYDRYCIIDDDVLISSLAPPIPDVPVGKIGLVRDEVQVLRSQTDQNVNYNTGFIVVHKADLHYLEHAVSHGDEKSLPGPYDQGALNYVLSKSNNIFEIDIKWNYQFINHYIVNYSSWDKFDNNIRERLYYYFNIRFNPLYTQRKMLSDCFGAHLIKCRFPKIISDILP